MSTAPTTPESATDGPTLTYPAGLPDDVSPLGERAAGAFRTTLTVTGAARLILLVRAIIDARPFFLARIGLYFAVWVLCSAAMRNWSARQDAEGGAALTRRMQWWAPSGLLLLGVTATFFAFDVMMSLQYTWFSTIYGVYFWAGG